MIRVKLELDDLTEDQFIGKLRLIVTKGTGNANFPNPNPPLINLTSAADTMETKIALRDALLAQAQQVTLEIRSARDLGTNATTALGGWVENRVNTLTGNVDPAARKAMVVSMGMETASDATPVGPMPKITGLFATQGDGNGEIDLGFNPIRRGLRLYILECTTDPAGQTGWGNPKTTTKSSFTWEGLVSGTRYWFRVRAVGTAGEGPWSDPATKVAP